MGHKVIGIGTEFYDSPSECFGTFTRIVDGYYYIFWDDTKREEVFDLDTLEGYIESSVFVKFKSSQERLAYQIKYGI